MCVMPYSRYFLGDWFKYVVPGRVSRIVVAYYRLLRGRQRRNVATRGARGYTNFVSRVLRVIMINVWPWARSIRTRCTKRVEEVSRVADCCRRCRLFTRAVTRSHTNPHHCCRCCSRSRRRLCEWRWFAFGVYTYTIIIYTSDDLNFRWNTAEFLCTTELINIRHEKINRQTEREGRGEN